MPSCAVIYMKRVTNNDLRREDRTMKKTRRMRRIGTALLAIMMMFALSASVFGETASAASAIDESAALKIALKNAGLSKSSVRMIEVEKESSKSIDVEFVRSSNKAEYSYEIAVKDGRILEKAVEYKYTKTTSKSKIGQEKARKAVAAFSGISYNTIKKGTCTYQYSKKMGKYEVKFRSGSYKYEYELLAKTGKVIEYEYEYTGTR